MSSDDLAPERVLVGQFAGVFGVKGWLKVKSFTQPEENILDYSPWYLRTAHGLKRVEIDDSKVRPQGIIVHIRGLDDRDEAALMGRVKIEVAKSQLPDLSEGDFYWHQLEGLQVVTHWPEGHCLGRVDRLMETGANDVLVVVPTEDSIDSRERLIPYIPEQYVAQVDLQKGLLHVKWDPEF